MAGSDTGITREVEGRRSLEVGTSDTPDRGDYVEYCGIKVWYVRTLAGDYTCNVSKYKKLLEVAS